MRIRFLLSISLVLVAAGPAPAAPEQDLGLGLRYVRVHQLPGDLPAAAPQKGQTCILDLRYVGGDAALGESLADWLRQHSSPRTPVFLLANRQTGGALLTPFAAADAIPGLVIIGASAPGFAPDIGLAVTATDDQRAYDAVEKGVPADSLLNDAPDKPRNDEARLAREHLADGQMNDSPPTAESAETRKPRPLVDAVLLRAVQLHRSLIALRRL